MRGPPRIAALRDAIDARERTVADQDDRTAASGRERMKLEKELERIGEELNVHRDLYNKQVRRTAKADLFLARLIQGATEVRNGL